MDERDSVAVEPGAGLRVDHVGASLGELTDGYGDIGDLVGDMVHPGATLGEKAPDRRVLGERAHELDPAGPNTQIRGLDALVLHATAQLDLRAEETLVRADGLVEVGDGERDVMDGADVHAPILSGGLLVGLGLGDDLRRADAL
jgi:hypothetical protein